MITKAYRSYCDKCASAKKACAGCCGDMNELRAKELSNEKKSNTDAIEQDEEGVDQEDDNDEDELSDNDDNVDEDDMDDDKVDEDVNNTDSKSKSMLLDQEETDNTTGVLVSDASAWNENKFLAYANKKYSKNRVVGNEDSNEFSSSNIG